MATLNSALPAYIITGPTSGYGYRTAQKLAGHGPLILVGRNPGKLDEVSKTVEGQGGHAVPVVCDLSDPVAAGRAAAEIVSLTVVGPDACEADRFATAAFAMGKDGISFIERYPGLEGYMIDKNGMATMTSGFRKYTVPSFGT